MRPVPQRYQEFVERIGGKNRFGGGNYRVIWGPDRIELGGGAWKDADGSTQIEMREYQKYGPDPVWVLEKWIAPEDFGDPRNWEEENVYRLDNLLPDHSIQVIGGYPYRGDYEHSFSLSGTLYFYTLEKLIRLNIHGKTISTEERQAARQAALDKEKTAFKQKVIDMYKDRAPAFYGPVSFHGQGTRTALLDRLDHIVKAIENGKSGEEMKAKYGLGLTEVE
jgi:hypothetical protein